MVATVNQARHNHGSTENTAKLVTAERWFRPGTLIEEVPRVKIRIAQEFEECSVKFICPAFREHVYLSEIVTILRAVTAGVHLEFLERIYRWLDEVRSIIRIGVFDPIKHVVVIFEALAGNVELEIAAIPAARA